MKNDNALISTAVLTAIWDDSHKDNIELVIPFVSNIIFNKFKVNDLIDEEYIIRQLKEKFCFNKFPHAVLKIVLNRMKRRNILKLDNKKFILRKIDTYCKNKKRDYITKETKKIMEKYE